LLYTAASEIHLGGKSVDRSEVGFGIRTISFDAKKGFLLNGKPVFLKGGCMHHDNGVLGAAAFNAAEERRVRTMKASGFNAIRTSHNPPSPAFLDACDRLGVMVIDEIFDYWKRGKSSNDYSRDFDEWWERDVTSMVRRDFNHPSVIMWSIGNEIPERGSKNGLMTARKLAGLIRELDSTRPVTEAVNGTKRWDDMDDYFANLDVAGYNYQQQRYVPDHAKHPGRVMYASESFPIHAFEFWMAVLDHPWVIGDFVWTGHDYLGEASIGWHSFQGGGYPWTVAYCGDLDICGFKRAQSYYRDILWETGSRISVFVHSPEPTFGERKRVLWGWDDVHASWNWPGREGEEMKVDVYSGCERVQLLLNGKELGEKATSRETKFKGSWTVPYEPGTLRAVGFDGGREVAAWTLKTAGEPAKISLRAEKPAIAAGGQDLCYVIVQVLDADGNRQPRGENLVRFSIEGPGTIAGVGNGNPVSVESFQSGERKAFEGRLIAVVRSGKKAGEVKLTAESDGLESDSVKIEVKKR
jgi:beta-galactosidase